MNLIESFSEIKDFRRAEGKRYPLLPMLLIVMMSIICGRPRYREIAKFADANKDEFIKFFRLKRKQMPSHVTFREIIQKIDFQQVCQAFENWSKDYVSIRKGDWCSIDGKAICSTVSDYDNSYQNFVSFVSVFAQKQGQVIAISRFHHGKSREIPTVEQLIRMLGLQDIVFTMDA